MPKEYDQAERNLLGQVCKELVIQLMEAAV